MTGLDDTERSLGFIVLATVFPHDPIRGVQTKFTTVEIQCPGIVDGEHCGQRVAKLYRPPRGDLYLCRHCYDLGYMSSRTSGDKLKQAELRYRRAYSKINKQGQRPHPNSDQVPYFPDRPKGMHHDTYEALVDELTQARLEWEDAWMERLRQMTQDL